MPGRIAGAQASATATVWLAVTAQITSSASRRQFGVRGGKSHAMPRRVFGERALVRGAELDVVRTDPRHAARAQVLGENAADLAVADEADGNLRRRGQGGHPGQSTYLRPAFASGSRMS